VNHRDDLQISILRLGLKRESRVLYVKHDSIIISRVDCKLISSQTFCRMRNGRDGSDDFIAVARQNAFSLSSLP
jgi:hypothetical protein